MLNCAPVNICAPTKANSCSGNGSGVLIGAVQGYKEDTSVFKIWHFKMQKSWIIPWLKPMWRCQAHKVKHGRFHLERKTIRVVKHQSRLPRAFCAISVLTDAHNLTGQGPEQPDLSGAGYWTIFPLRSPPTQIILRSDNIVILFWLGTWLLKKDASIATFLYIARHWS